MRNFAPEINKHDDFVAQLVEQLTLNQWVESSSLSEVTKVNGSSFLNFHFLFVSSPIEKGKAPTHH